MPQMAEKDIASRAAELCGGALAPTNIIGGKNMYISNIDHQKVQALTALVNVMPGQIVSRTLAQNKAVSITLFAFDKGTEISTHESTGDAMVQVLEGTGCFTVDGKGIPCASG